MDDIAPEYDVVVLGTGLTECVLSGVLSVGGQKVLHIDRNDHYGGEAASVNIETLFRKYGNVPAGEEPWKKYGRPNDWNVDLVPKFLMSTGDLTNILVSTNVTRYLDFKQIAGSYVQMGDKKKVTVAKVPTEEEAWNSGALSTLQKAAAANFFRFVSKFDENDPGTHAGIKIDTATMATIYKDYWLGETAQDLIGHAMALYQTDDYLNTPGKLVETISRIRLYGASMKTYGKSPYIYPLYGLGELPQGFARLSAIYGGTYMLNTDIDEIQYDGDKVSGISATMKNFGEDGSGGKFSTKTKKIIADPTYFPGKTRVVGHLLKAICILKHPIDKTDGRDSIQLIIPQKQVGRKHDVYVAMVSSAHNVCPKGYYVATVSTIAENEANHHLELQPGLDRLGTTEEIFMAPPIPILEPTEDGTNDNIYLSKSYDASTHFESTTDDIRDIYRRAVGEELVVEGLRETTNLVSGEEE
ncbi:Rab GDP dissociation inhibitor alpha [Arachnomyces sp. PD_36]|nr:Rab GDP dissociation inhibitor alpha [Arachnomyces sp. PD_36]